MVKSPIVARINSILAEKGISKQDFYRDCGLSSAAYSLWNTGKTSPRSKSLKVIADYLNVAVSDLLPNEEIGQTYIEESPIQEVLNRIEDLIVKSGMTKQEFYDRSGISSGSFSQWNTGTHSPSIKKLQCAADTLNVSLDYILHGKDTPTVEAEKGIKKDPATMGGELDEITRILFNFAKTGSREEVADVLQYIEFVESKRNK